MTETRKNVGRPRPLAWTLCVLAALAAVLAIVPAGASAASVSCTGKTARSTSTPGDIDFRFKCDEEIKSFTVLSSQSLTGFSTAMDVIDPTSGNPVPGQTFSCEGSIPSDGFGCAGDATTPNWVTGSLSPEESPCGAQRLRLWVVPVDASGHSAEPYPLRGVSCPKARKPTKKRSSHR